MAAKKDVDARAKPAHDDGEACALAGELVMAGLVPAIHVFLVLREIKTWMPAPSAGMTISSARQ